MLESAGILQDTLLQFSPKSGKLLGISYRRSNMDSFMEVIVFGKDGKFRFTTNKQNLMRLKEFRDTLELACF